MTTILVVFAFVIVALAVGVAYFLRRTPANQAALDNAMLVSSGLAIEQARVDHGLHLDGSPESVEQVEAILAALNERHRREPIPFLKLANMTGRWGAYIGEAAKRARAGAWNNRGLVHDDGMMVFPADWARARILGGPEDNVWNKFQLTYLRDRLRPLDLSASDEEVS